MAEQRARSWNSCRVLFVFSPFRDFAISLQRIINRRIAKTRKLENAKAQSWRRELAWQEAGSNPAKLAIGSIGELAGLTRGGGPTGATRFTAKACD
jgi:hypothetical protein